MSEHNWWEEEDGTCICHLCTKPVDPANPETMFGLSGAPVHGSCGSEAMENGKAVRVGRWSRGKVPVKLEGGRIIGSATLHPDETGVRVEATITDPAMIEYLGGPGPLSGISINKGGSHD